MINILIADDHQMVIDGLVALLAGEEDIRIVGQAQSGQEVIHLLNQSGSTVDLLVLDINMPGVDGIEVASYVRNHFAHVRILVLSMYNKQVFIKNLIELGVSGYILKNAGKDDLLTAIRRIHKGEDYFSEEVTQTLVNTFKNPAKNPDVKLTKREEEILKLLADAKTTAEIADQLFLSPYTVDTHRKNLLGKLGLKNTPALVKFALENGYGGQRF